MYYFAYSVSSGYFQRTVLSKLCSTEHEIMCELESTHNGDAIGFYLKDGQTISVSEYDNVSSMINAIYAIYGNHHDTEAIIHLANYIITQPIHGK